MILPQVTARIVEQILKPVLSVKGHSVLNAKVHHDLRVPLPSFGQTGKRTTPPYHGFYCLQCSHDPVTRGCIIAENDVTRRLRTQDGPGPGHLLQYVPVPYRSPQQGYSSLPQSALQTYIGHDGPHNGTVGESTGVLQLKGTQEKDIVTIYKFSAFIAQNDPVSIPIKGDADIRATFQYGPGHGLRGC